MEKRSPGYVQAKLKKIFKNLDRGQQTHGLALFKDYKEMNNQIALFTDKVFCEILENEVKGSEEATLFLKRLKDGQKRLSVDLKKMRLDKRSQDFQLLKKAKDRIQFWRFEGEELWRVTNGATKKTVRVVQQFAKKWKQIEKEMQYLSDDQQPQMLEYVRKLTANISDSDQKQALATEYVELFKKAFDHEKTLRHNLTSGKDQLHRKLQKALSDALDNVCQKRIQEIQVKDEELEKVQQFTQDTLSEFEALAALPTVGNEGDALVSKIEQLQQLIESQAQAIEEIKVNTDDLTGYFETSLEKLFAKKVVPNEAISSDTKYMIEPKRSSINMHLYDCVKFNDTQRQINFLIPNGFGFINLRKSGYLAGGWKQGKFTKDVVQIFHNAKNVNYRDPLKEAKSGLSLAAIKNQSLIFALGGYNGKEHLSQVEIYQSDKNLWEWFSPMKHKRSAAGCCGLDPYHLIYVFGGFSDIKGSYTSLERFNYDNPGKGWKVIEIQHQDWKGLYRIRVAQLSQNKLLVFGGHENTDSYEITVNEDGSLLSVEPTDQMLQHSEDHSFKVVGGRLYASNNQSEMVIYENSKWNTIE